MINQIRALIKRVVQLTTCDNGPLQQTTISYMGREVKSQVLHPYGMYTSPPKDSIGIAWSVSGTETDQVAIVYSPEHYGQPLQETEVLLGNFVKDATLKFDDEGNVHLTVPKTVYITCIDSVVTCSGDSTLNCVNSTTNASGSASITCDSAMIAASSSFDVSAGASASITAPTIALNGAVSAPQGMAVTGGMTSEGIEVSKTDHTHKAGNLKDSGGGACSGETAPDA